MTSYVASLCVCVFLPETNSYKYQNFNGLSNIELYFTNQKELFLEYLI